MGTKSEIYRSPGNWAEQFKSILFWSIISAAFIGPGTVTTAATAGAKYGWSLVWALVFSVVACMLVQEAAMRIPIASGRSLGEAISRLLGGENKAWWIKFFLAGAIYVGGIAYQAGNILGAVEGIKLLFPGWERYLIVPMGLVAAIVLWYGSDGYIARLLGLVVAVMALIFISMAIVIIFAQWKGGILSSRNVDSQFFFIPPGSESIILGLIGTTIVPYNIFLASGLKNHQNLRINQIGIYWAVLLGGILTLAIMIVGSAVSGQMSFNALAEVLEKYMGKNGRLMLGIGLWAAGFTSALTAPLAATITAKTMFNVDGKKDTAPNARRMDWIWISILFIGVGLALTGLKPIPVIILAQALNGCLLPVIIIVLLIVINEPEIIPESYRNGKWKNGGMLFVVWLSLILGMRGIWKALSSIIQPGINEDIIILVMIIVATMITIYVGLSIKR